MSPLPSHTLSTSPKSNQPGYAARLPQTDGRALCHDLRHDDHVRPQEFLPYHQHLRNPAPAEAHPEGRRVDQGRRTQERGKRGAAAERDSQVRSCAAQGARRRAVQGRRGHGRRGEGQGQKRGCRRRGGGRGEGARKRSAVGHEDRGDGRQEDERAGDEARAGHGVAAGQVRGAVPRFLQEQGCAVRIASGGESAPLCDLATSFIYTLWGEQSIADAMEDADTELPVAHIAALAEMSRFAPDVFEKKSEVVMTYLIKRVLMVPSPVDPVRWSLGILMLILSLFPFYFRRLRTTRTRKRSGWMTMRSPIRCGQR